MLELLPNPQCAQIELELQPSVALKRLQVLELLLRPIDLAGRNRLGGETERKKFNVEQDWKEFLKAKPLSQHEPKERKFFFRTTLGTGLARTGTPDENSFFDTSLGGAARRTL